MGYNVKQSEPGGWARFKVETGTYPLPRADDTRKDMRHVNRYAQRPAVSTRQTPEAGALVTAAEGPAGEPVTGHTHPL